MPDETTIKQVHLKITSFSDIIEQGKRLGAPEAKESVRLLFVNRNPEYMDRLGSAMGTVAVTCAALDITIDELAVLYDEYLEDGHGRIGS